MIDPFAARSVLLDRARPLPMEETNPGDAAGRWLARAVTAPEARPRADNSAMDGYALRAADAAGAGPGRPIELVVVGEARADADFPGTVGEGEAVRISTGGTVPPGADTVVPVERTGEAQGTDGAAGGRVAILAAPSTGDHIRRRGEELEVGDEILPAGARVGPAGVGLLASLGFRTVPVHRRVRVAVIVTGQEFVASRGDEPSAGAEGEDPRSGGFPGALDPPGDANGPMLRALLALPYVIPTRVEHVGDRAEELAGALRRLAADPGPAEGGRGPRAAGGIDGGAEAPVGNGRREGVDVVLSTGGASVGPHDVVEEAWELAGAETLFRRVSMKPGKPVRGGVLPIGGERGAEAEGDGGTLLVALPGNPQSVLAGFEHLVEPLLRKLAGGPPEHGVRVLLPLAAPLHPHPRTRFLRARIEGKGRHARLHVPEVQGSGMLLQAARCPLVAVVPADDEERPAGSLVLAVAGEDGVAGRSWVPAAEGGPADEDMGGRDDEENG